jgi:hypothetical protein
LDKTYLSVPAYFLYRQAEKYKEFAVTHLLATLVLIIDADGVLQAPNLKDCDGKSVEELLDSGRAFYIMSASDD